VSAGTIREPMVSSNDHISKFEAADSDQLKWSQSAYSVFWAERITVRRRMGCSPYFAATGTQPLIPLDILEGSYLLPPPESVLSTMDLIARRAIALQKRASDLERLHSDIFTARRWAAFHFERENIRTIKNFDFKRGSLVLVRNMKSLWTERWRSDTLDLA
jgi:hypothetical protein